MVKKLQFVLTLALLLFGCNFINAQVDSILSRIAFESDFRFRIEQDWDSRKSDGTFRDDRTRLRYRVRTGMKFTKDCYSLGVRIRTGEQNKQQDPQLTIGTGSKEFGTLPIGFEKIFFEAKFEKLRFWLGKNSYSFEKNNELFWSDNVFPEGVFLEHNFKFDLKSLNKISLKAAHYILSSNGQSFSSDAYFQGIQSSFQLLNQRLTLFPSLYLMRNIPNIPDGGHTFLLDYSIFHIGGKINPLLSGELLLDFDFYQNMEDYSGGDKIAKEFANEKSGYSFGLQYGALKNAKDWVFKITYTSLQKFAALDYMAQNDWARWDYSSYNSPDGRLTNYRGVELVVGYNITKYINMIAKYYHVNELVPTGPFEETGQRVRLDLNVKI